MGGSDEKSSTVRSNSNIFPLKKVDIHVSASNSPQKSILKESYIHETPDKRSSYRTLETEATSDYYGG